MSVSGNDVRMKVVPQEYSHIPGSGFHALDPTVTVTLRTKKTY